MDLKVGTLNVGAMIAKGRELVDMMIRRFVNEKCRWRSRKAKKKKRLGTELKYLFHNVDGKRN